MNHFDFETATADFFENCALNIITEQIARADDVIGKRIYGKPVFGFANAADPLFFKLKDDDVVSRRYILPEEWLTGAKTVISFFIPFTAEVEASNALRPDWPSDEWLHARIEGQQIISELCLYLADHLEKKGFRAVSPLHDTRFKTTTSADSPAYADIGKEFTSNWSERHTAYICGLGTFGLSRCFLTKIGTAGRLGSLITDAYVEPTHRDYEDIYEYCSFCGVCAKHCPVGAIGPHGGKDHKKCSDFIDKVTEVEEPYYGCGKCQTGVPCQKRVKKNGRQTRK